MSTLANGTYTEEERERIETKASKLFTDMLCILQHMEGHGVAGVENTCLLWAMALHVVLVLEKRKSILRLGTVQYMMVREEDDDGVSPTHFSYVFNTEGVGAFLLGHVPQVEHHAWVHTLDPKTEEAVIIDPSAAYSYQQAVKLVGPQVMRLWKATDRFTGWVWLRERVMLSGKFQHAFYSADSLGGLEYVVLAKLLSGLLPSMAGYESLREAKHVLEQTALRMVIMAKKKGVIL